MVKDEDVQGGGAEGAAEAATETTEAVASYEAAFAQALEVFAEQESRRQSNSSRSGGLDKKAMKADMKKSSAFVKRVKNLEKEADIEWALTQAKAINLTRYVVF